MVRELEVAELAWQCPDEWIPWKSSTEVVGAESIVGQDRALQAISFGLGMRGVGYNVFVTGLSGTGRLTTIKRFLEGRADGHPRPDDVCFVYNFLKPDEPNAVILRAGAGRRLRDGMDGLVRGLAESIPEVLKDQAFRDRLEGAVGELQQQERELVQAFEKEVADAGFGLVQIQVGPVTRPEVLPVVDGEPVAMEILQEKVEEKIITLEDATRLTERYEELKGRLQEVFDGVSEIREQVQSRAEEVRAEILRPVLNSAVKRVQRSVGDRRVNDYLNSVKADLEENLEVFGGDDDIEVDRFLRWRVNLAVDNSHGKGRPVVMETEPSYTNLFGTVERSLTSSGDTITSFMRIRAGSLLSANGGFLVLNAEDLLMEPRVWPGLKRALKYRRVKIQSLEGLLLGATGLSPEAVPLDVKVVVIGDRGMYDLLFRHDRDFSKIFKVLADFDMVIPAVEKRAGDMVSVFAKVIAEEDLLPLDHSGMGCLLEESVRMSRGRKRFSTRFSDLSDVLREASWTASEDGAEAISRSHVKQARAAARRRHSLSEDRTYDFLEDGVIRIETEGRAIGRVNGLAVYDLGHHRFGRPSKISAQVGVGREGVINIERQAGLSGPTHDKGVQILTGFLRGTFAQRGPLSMACSVTFEQSYGGIDGDSASSTEIYAILSALAQIPIRQGVAVTGSVAQYGGVQSIGGVNEKIEGFFRVCSSRELTGDQGVMIPASDVNDLHLSDEVRDAVAEGRFHVWPVETIEEGIEHLTGTPAGTLDEDGNWPEDTVFGRCQRRLEEMTRLLRSAGKPEEGSAAGDEDDADTPGESEDENVDEPEEEGKK